MSDAMRNAIINLQLKIQNPNVKVDLSGVIKQQQALEKAQQAQAAASDVQTKANDNLMKSLGAAVKTQQPMLDATRKLSEAQQGLKLDSENLAAAVEMENNAAAKSTAARTAQISTSVNLSKANQDLNKTYGEIGEGALQLGRGLAFLGLSQNDNIKQAVQLVAAMSGAMDTYKGVIKIVENLTKANEALATSQGSVNVETSAGKTAAAGTSTALATLNPYIIAGTAALTAGAVVWKLYTDRTNAAAEADLKAAEAFKKNMDARRQGIESVDAGRQENRAIDQAIIDLAPTTEGKISRTRLAIEQNSKLMAAERQVAMQSAPTLEQAMAASQNRGDADPMGAGADKIVAEYYARTLAAQGELRALTEDRVMLETKLRDLTAGMIQKQQAEFERRAGDSRNKDGSSSKGSSALADQAAAFSAEAEAVIAEQSRTVEIFLEAQKKNNERWRQMEYDASRAKGAARVANATGG